VYFIVFVAFTQTEIPARQRMKLPADAIIAAEKVTRYLLVRQTRGDRKKE
jgi:hypothetical protein